jgi:hypothetical protein
MLKATKIGSFRLKEDTAKMKKGSKMFRYKVTGPKAELAEFAKHQKSKGMESPVMADGSVLYITAFNKVNTVTQLEKKWDGTGYNHLDTEWENFTDSVAAIEDEQIKAIFISKTIDSAITSTRAVMSEVASGFVDLDDDDDSDDDEEIVTPPARKTAK